MIADLVFAGAIAISLAVSFYVLVTTNLDE